MSSVAHSQTRAGLNEIGSNIRTNSGWFIVLGILQILAGFLALSFCFSATIASVAVLGSILIVAAGAQIAAAILARSWKGFFLFLLVGILYGVTGLLTLAHPLAAAAGLTLMLAAALMAGGVLRIVVSVAERFPSWAWVALNGVVSVLLGLMIAAQWPVSGLWVIGMFVGIDLIVNGIAWTTLAAEARSTLTPTA